MRRWGKRQFLYRVRVGCEHWNADDSILLVLSALLVFVLATLDIVFSSESRLSYRFLYGQIGQDHNDSARRIRTQQLSWRTKQEISNHVGSSQVEVAKN